jgi:hypothetical protein
VFPILEQRYRGHVRLGIEHLRPSLHLGMDPGAVHPDLSRWALHHESGRGNLALCPEFVDLERLVAHGGALVVPQQSSERSGQ